MRVLITGADGFVGRGLVERLLQCEPSAEIVATDRAFRHLRPSDRRERIAADLADADAVEGLFLKRFDLIFHLASIPGSAAERLADKGRAINRDAALRLIDLTARGSDRVPPSRFVFASSIAVYGALPAGEVTEDSATRPVMAYGADKLAVERELADRTRRGAVIGASLRLPGIVARPVEESGHGSAFMSRIFHAAARGEAYSCPVSPQARCWWMSRNKVIDNLIHAAKLSPDVLTHRVAWQLPVLAASVGDMIEALGRRYGTLAVDGITYDPDPAIGVLFGAMPRLSAPEAERVGFSNDGTIDRLVRSVHPDEA